MYLLYDCGEAFQYYRSIGNLTFWFSLFPGLTHMHASVTQSVNRTELLDWN